LFYPFFIFFQHISLNSVLLKLILGKISDGRKNQESRLPGAAETKVVVRAAGRIAQSQCESAGVGPIAPSAAAVESVRRRAAVKLAYSLTRCPAII